MKTPASLRILLLEDDLRLVEPLCAGLRECGHTIVTATTTGQARQLVDKEKFDVIVVDVALPERSGYIFAQHLRTRPNHPAVVMLAAPNPEDPSIRGLGAGDRDLIQPFWLSELTTRIHSVARRTRVAAKDNFRFGPFRLDMRGRRLVYDQTEIPISRSEYLLLRALAMHRGEVVSRRQLMQAVWGTTISSHGALDTLVNTLREKLHDRKPGFISTVRDTGYRLEEHTD